MNQNKPEIIKGKSICDDRGFVKFINDFDPSEYKRFYIVENHKQGFIRAWHGHKFEGKAVLCIAGSAKIGVVNLETDEIFSYYITEYEPTVIVIPPNHANGFKSLTKNCKLMFFSDKTLEESLGDDIRFEYNKWNIWEEIYR